MAWAFGTLVAAVDSVDLDAVKNARPFDCRDSWFDCQLQIATLLPPEANMVLDC
jgi:hypothetical protein